MTLFDVTRLDQSGRLSGRALVRALGWRAGQRLDITVAGTSIIGPHQPAVLIADLARNPLLVVHPAAVVARMLAELAADG